MQFNLNRAIEILERTPILVEHYLTGLSEEWIHQNEGDDTWSPYDIVGHLIHGEKTDWIPRAKIIVYQEGERTFTPFDRFAQLKDSQGKPLTQVLEEFKLLRNDNLNELRVMNITEQMLEMEGIHPELGVVTLKQLLSTWVAHDLGHIAQVSRVMANQYKHEVGPWKAYLKIIN